MIIDKIENLPLYLPLNSGIEPALEFINDFLKEPVVAGKYEIDGEKVFAMVQSYETKPRAGALFEAHKKFIDLQFMFKGKERILCAPIDNLTQESEEYSAGNDIAFFSGETGTDLILNEGVFTLLFPQDAHMPCLRVNEAESVTKIVIKIMAD